MTAETSKLLENYNEYGATAETSNSERTEKSLFFPLRPCWLLEKAVPSLCEHLPCCMREVHSLAHLTLLLGIFITFAMLTCCVADYRHAKDRVPDWWAALALVGSFVFSASCLLQLMLELGQFNVDLQARAKELHTGTKDMMENFNKLAKEVDRMVQDSMDTQAALAERSLESQRRDCLRFFQSIEGKLQRQGEQQALLGIFRSFVELWLNVFAECSINPDTKPYQVVTPAEIRAAKSSAEIAQLVGSSLKKREIKFLSDRVEEDRKVVLSWIREVVLSWLSYLKACRLAGFGKDPDPERGDTLKTDWGGEVKDAVTADASRQTKWLIFGFGMGRGFVRPEDAVEDGFPLEFSAWCFRCTFLSAGHLRLICIFFFGAFLVPFNLFVVNEPQRFVAVALFSCMVCVAVLLHQYQTVNQVFRLERQITLLQERQNNLNEVRTKMLDFYKNVQQLADFWLYRTLPRLEFMKQCADELEDIAEGDKLLDTLTELVQLWGMLESALLPVHMWRDEHAVSLSCKKQLAAAYNELTNAGSMTDCLKKMPKAVEVLSQRKQEAMLQVGNHSNFSTEDAAY